METEARIQRRHRHVNYMGEWSGAIDGSSGMDTVPEDYVEVAGDGFTPSDSYIVTPPPAEVTTSPDAPPPVPSGMTLDAAVAYGRGITASASQLRHGDFSWALLSGMYEPGDVPDWISDGGDRVGLKPGFYSAVCEVDIGWPAAAAPDRVRFRMANTVGDAYDGWTGSDEMVDVTLSSGGTRKGVQKVLSWGDFVISEDSGEGLMLTADFYGGSSADDGMDGRLELAGADNATINWYITRLGESPAPPASVGGVVIASSSTFSSPSGYPSFDDWTFEENTVGATTTGDHIFNIPAGTYVGRLRLDVTVTSPQYDHSISCNIFSSSAYVTYEFPAPVVRTSGDLVADYAIGNMPVETGQGDMSVSFFYPESAGVPSVAGSCTYFLQRIA
jgi:hypothetical protein